MEIKRNRVVFLLVLAMVVQVFAPAGMGIAHGEEVGSQENSMEIEELETTSGSAIEVEAETDLSSVNQFKYEANLYVGEDKLDDGSIIEIEDLTSLEYSVDFTIEDGFVFEGNEYLELDLSALTELGELVLPED
ncbi:MAG TPA: hypothetical protein VFD79_01195, partial [Tissierellaceae bacterium]|nr:hypothetical protein [Tissierellaceae bacterium]